MITKIKVSGKISREFFFRYNFLISFNKNRDFFVRAHAMYYRYVYKVCMYLVCTFKTKYTTPVLFCSPVQKIGFSY